jgi:hypothetical protein
MEDKLHSYPAEKIMSQILLEVKNYQDAIKSNKLLFEVKEIRARMRKLMKELKDLYPANTIEIEIKGIV